MVKFKFFTHCSGWAVGGYENTHFAENAKEAKRIVAGWNEKYAKSGIDSHVELLSVEEVTDAEFAADYIGA